MPPGSFDQAVVERQSDDIEPDVGRALYVVVAAEDVRPHAGTTDIAGGQQRNAARTNVGGTHRMLGLSHRPDQGRRFFLGELLGDALELFTRHAADALDLLRRPLLDLLAHVVHAVDTLLDELLVLPTVLEDVPQHAPQNGNVSPRPHTYVLGRVGGGARQARIDDDEISSVKLLAFEQMLQGDRMRFGGIAAEEDERLGVADVGVAVGHGAVAPRVGYAGDRRGVANARLVIGIVGAPERCELPEQIGALVGYFRRAKPIDRVRPRLLADRGELVADLAHGLVPGHTRPLAVDQLHRVAQTPIAVHKLAHRGTLGAMRPAIDRRIPAGLLADPH